MKRVMWIDSLREIGSRLRKLIRPTQGEAEMDDELRFHIDQQTEQYINQGMTPGQARREAVRQFGGIEQIREDVRDTMTINWISDLVRDSRLATRSLLSRPAFATTVALILGLAIGLSTTIFSFVQAILLRPLPYPDADRLVVIQSVNPDHELQMYGVSWPDLFDWREQATVFEGIAAYRSIELDLTDGTSTERQYGMSCTRNIFNVLGVPLAVGQSFSEEDETSREQRLVLSQGLWQRRFQADPEIVGRNQDVYSWMQYPNTGITQWLIVGTAGMDVPFPPSNNELGHARGLNQSVDFWMPPWVFDKNDRASRYQFKALARLKPGVSVEQAAAEMKTIAARLADEYPDTNSGWSADVVTMRDLVLADVRPALWLLCGAVAFLLVIACANVASLLIVRGIARQQEFAVRIALGAGRGRLIRQLLTESLLLCLVGGVLGVLLSIWSVDLVRYLAPADIPRLQDVNIDGFVLSFALGLSVTTGIVVGMLPSMLSSRIDVNSTLKSGGRSATAIGSHRRLMNTLVAGELAVSLVLLTGAVLLIRSFSTLAAVDPGFRTDRLLTMTVSLPQAKYEWKHNSEFCVELVTKLNATPGIESASAIRGVPTRETHFDSQLHFEGRPILPKDERPQGKARVIEPGFFETMEVPLLEGRLFEPADSIGEIGWTKVTICNETFARRFFPNESPLGKRFTVLEPGEAVMEIVGVVGDVRYTGLGHEPHAEFYYPEALFPQTEFTLLLRTTGDPDAIAGTVEQIVRDAEPDVVITAPDTMDDVLSESLSRERFLMLLLSSFSIGAFVLSVTGHYGVMSYSVSQRRQELGIRMALGATPGSVVRRIVLDGLRLAVIGLAVGVAASFAGAKLIESELYGIRATDPVTLTGAVAVMLCASALAALIPSLRGARIEPAVVLRGD